MSDRRGGRNCVLVGVSQGVIRGRVYLHVAPYVPPSKKARLYTHPIHYIHTLYSLSNLYRMDISEGFLLYVGHCMQATYAGRKFFSLRPILTLHDFIHEFVTAPVHASSTFLIWPYNGDQSSIGLLFQLAGLDQLGDHFSDIPGFQAAANMLLEGANSCRLAKQAPSADVIDQPFDPFSTLSDRSDALGAEAQLLPGSP